MLKSKNPPRCKYCRERTEKVGKLIHDHCIDPWLAVQLAKQQRKKEAAQRAKAKVERAQDRRAREAMKRHGELIAEAQDAFNAYIRARDRDKGCFVCDKPFPVGRLGGDFDAGHVRSRGAAGHLRFNEDNCHGECKECNSSFGAKPHEIEEGAIRRIGPERYEALKNNNTPVKLTKDEIREIRGLYRAKLKALKQGE